MKHHPNCAVVRSGNIRAWCDCGVELPVMNELRAKVSEKIGAGKERAAIVRWLRGRGGRYDELFEEIANDIEEGNHIDEKF